MANHLLALADLIEDEKHQAQHWCSGSETTVLERLGKTRTGYITFWQATSLDAVGRLSSSRTGDGLDNVQYREDFIQDVREDFQYDKQNPLTNSQVVGHIDGVQYRHSANLRYDANGNISFKSDVGDYDYGESGAGPHALTSAGAHHTGYRYDKNGNMTAGGGKIIEVRPRLLFWYVDLIKEDFSMPRRLRITRPGVPLHLIQRGNNRRACFFRTMIARFISIGWRRTRRRVVALSTLTF